jgi:hypothetical protein
MGVGIAELRATVILELEVAAETWVEAAAPVRTRATTAARTMMFFMTAPGTSLCRWLKLVYLADSI